MEWTIVGVIVVLIGLIAAVAKPMLSWNTNLVQNTEAIKNLTATIGCNESNNEKEHIAIWDEVEKQGVMLNKHETDIAVIKEKVG